MEPRFALKDSIYLKWKWIFDPVPEFILKDELKYKKYTELASQFAIKQLEIEKRVISLEQEMIKAHQEFFAG